MKIKLIQIVIAFCFIACSQQKNSGVFYEKQLCTSISFFDKAFDQSKGVYFSELDEKGNLISEDVHIVALSRMVYGLSYAAYLNPDYLEKANMLVDYQLQFMLAKDELGNYFIPTVPNNEHEKVEYLDIWQQAYGLCGMTELYRITHNDELLLTIRDNTNLLIERFRDKKHGGFFADYKIGEGGVPGSKTLQSLMYPITAFMGNLWLADLDNRGTYETLIKEHLAIIYKVVWNDSQGWVNLRYNDQWEPVFTESDVISPGHNFQLAALLLRTGKWSFISVEDQKKYRQLAQVIIKTTLNKPIWGAKGVSDGFYENINPVNDQIVSNYKSWWQHCEALIALSFVKKEFGLEFDQLYDYYFSTFSDEEWGGEWAKVDESNRPVIEPKGQKGKSVYHHIELIRFLQEANIQ